VKIRTMELDRKAQFPLLAIPAIFGNLVFIPRVFLPVKIIY